MGTFHEFDPVFGDILGVWSTVTPDAERERLKAEGKSWLEIEGSLPAGSERFAVNADRQIVVRQPLPAACRLGDGQAGLDATVPEVPGLPAGGVVIPAVGTPLPSGLTTIVVRAPFHLDHHFNVYVETPGDRHSALLAHAAARRDMLIGGGISFRGHVIASDDRCAMKVLRAVEAARRDPAWSTIWECADGAALPMAGADIGALHDAIEANHDAAFARYSIAKAGIVAGTITTPEQADAAMARDT